MSYVPRTIIVLAQHQALARALIVAVAGESQEEMLTVPLALAKAPQAVVAFASSGPIESPFAQLLVDADALFAAVSAVGAAVSLQQCQALIADSVVVSLDDEPALGTLSRLGYVRLEPA